MNLNVFISSPWDVPTERKMIHRAIEALNPKLFRLYGCSLQGVDWNNFATLTTRGGGLRPQDTLNPWVRSCAIFIGILHQRYGTPAHPPKKQSGTEEEFNIALESRDRIAILTYFRPHPAGASSKQTSDVLSLLKRLERKGVVPKKYNSPSEFLPMVMADLLETVVSNLPEREHRDDMMGFFKLGRSLRQESPKAVIVYPPIHIHDPSGDQQSDNWHNRLVPNVVFEDMKAIQKVEAVLHKIGIRSVKAVTTLADEAHEHDQNNVWLCLPRNPLAKRRIRRYSKIARFSLVACGDSQNSIKWRSADPKKPHITVKSPLAQYLRIRGGKANNSPWHEVYGNIVARDFAVVARFKFEGPWKDQAQHNYPFWEYFIFGIRGLGTWGAAWFIHHKASELAAIMQEQKGEDVQILLQITYSRNRIHEVIDVSSKSQDYFDEQNNPETIENVVQDYPFG